MLALVVPIFVMYHNRALRADLRILYGLQILWLFGQILTDIYRQTPQIDWLRGNAGIVFFIMDLIFIAMLMAGNEKRKILFIASYAIGSIISTRLFPTAFSVNYPWKFGYANGVNLLCLLSAGYFYNKKKYSVVLLILLGISAVNLADNFRSPVLLMLVTIALTIPVVPEYVGPWRVLPPQGSRMRLFVLITLALSAGLIAAALVKTMASAGYLGEEAQQKNEVQTHVKGGLLIGGRPEIVVSSRAVLDSPILGHGSWARDYRYIEVLHDVMRSYGLEQQQDVDSMEEDTQGIIPTHSHLMEAWVYAGIAGAVFWFYLLWYALKLISQLPLKQPPFAPLFMFLCIDNVWAILFSPFGSTRRIMESFLIIMTFDLLRNFNVQAGFRLPFRQDTWRRGQFVTPEKRLPHNVALPRT